MAIKITWNKHTYFKLSVEYSNKVLAITFIKLDIRIYFDRSYFDLFNSYGSSKSVKLTPKESFSSDGIRDYFLSEEFANSFLAYVRTIKLFKEDKSDSELIHRLISSISCDYGTKYETLSVTLDSYFEMDLFNVDSLETFKKDMIVRAEKREAEMKITFDKLSWMDRVFKNIYSTDL